MGRWEDKRSWYRYRTHRTDERERGGVIGGVEGDITREKNRMRG